MESVGKSMKRVDARGKVTGEARYANDLKPKNCLTAKVVHATIANGRVLSIDTSEAEKVPGVVLRTTMIVGHPGEGKKDFKELLDFVADAKFERLGAFKYSEEEGTYGAENFKDSITARVKQERLDELMTLQSGISLDFNQSRVGTEPMVIVDDFVDGVFVCRSEFESPEVDGEILARYDSSVLGDVDPYSLVGEFIKVRIIGADEYDLIAEIIEI